MCWGYAKQIYRTFPLSKKADALRRNVQSSLDDIPIVTQRRCVYQRIFWPVLTRPSFVNRCLRFMDAYAHGLDGAMAAWAVRKYRGHRTVPENIMALFDAAHGTVDGHKVA
ncbi:hypothetical protein BD626DRAFT_392421 [Schizophyllum amplum]|uniref:Uncharacterized protein n=1 Tax=Schizophyllum amplum TaxID=97359 RepID=A0A550D0N7_9AGAR|nr:hypothetical protein BD626DRAFT_392421 [Auriculariopsis ampla]